MVLFLIYYHSNMTNILKIFLGLFSASDRSSSSFIYNKLHNNYVMKYNSFKVFKTFGFRNLINKCFNQDFDSINMVLKKLSLSQNKSD